MKLMTVWVFFEAVFHVTILSKPTPSDASRRQSKGTEENGDVRLELRKRANDALLVTLANDLQRRLQNDNSKQQLEKMRACLRGASNSSQYANCILSTLQEITDPSGIGVHTKPHVDRSKRQNNPNLKNGIKVELDLTSAMKHQQRHDGVRVEPDMASAMRRHELTDQRSSILLDSSAPIANVLTDIVRGFKSKMGPWHPDLSKVHFGNAVLDQKSSPNIDSLKDSLNLTKLVRESLEGLMQSPMFLLKSSPDQDSGTRKKRQNDDGLRFLSPRFLPFFDDSSARLLSPDFFSLFDSRNSVASLPSLLSDLKPVEKEAWLELAGELSGASDYHRWMQTDEFKRLLALYEQQQQRGSKLDLASSIIKNGNHLSFQLAEPRIALQHSTQGSEKSLLKTGHDDRPSDNVIPSATPAEALGDSSEDPTLTRGMGDVLQPVPKPGIVGEFLLSLTSAQRQSMNERGYAFLDSYQLDTVYGQGVVGDSRHWPFDMPVYLNWTDQERTHNTIPAIVASMMDDQIAEPVRKWKRQTGTGTESGPTFAMPTILAPAVGPPYVNTIFLNAPTVLSPAVFTPIINGPLVLSPYILSPYVFSPFIIAPQVLTPFVLNPYVLSPDILAPFVLSPTILSPNVLSPFILDPTVLSPVILSPAVGSPSILSPTVLSPLILSPTSLTATILSPGVLSPSILSDSDGPTILSPCALCRRKRRRRRK